MVEDVERAEASDGADGGDNGAGALSGVDLPHGQTAVSDSVRRILIWDGDCGFCQHWVGRIRSPATGRPEAIAWQRLGRDGLGSIGLCEADVAKAAYFIDAGGRQFRGHRAVSQALIDAGGIRAWIGRSIEIPPISALAAVVYWIVARTRRWLPAGGDTCRVEGPR
jgi:predicted DCC family thiol-disulfide oxidoreductase YuxK